MPAFLQGRPKTQKTPISAFPHSKLKLIQASRNIKIGV